MPHFKPCPKPEENQLMENDAQRFTYDQRVAVPLFHRIAASINYWIDEADWAEDQFSGGRYELAIGMVGGLNEVVEAVKQRSLTVHSVRQGLSFVAMTRLCRLVIPRNPQIPEWDGVGYGSANIVPEVLRDEEGNLARFSLHLGRDNVGLYFSGGAPTGEVDDWQQTNEGDLAVHRVFPAQPDAHLPALLVQRGVEVDFTDMCMLTPHLMWTRPAGRTS